MGYSNATIAEIIEGIDKHVYLLPVIQRKYVWLPEQIEKLFDSIMSDYPFGTFIFWKVKKETVNKNEYNMYEFVKNFHERDTVNEIASKPFTTYTIDKEHPNDYIYGVLDGQQRLTSLFISLKGTLQMKLPKKQWSNDDAFPKKEIYFDVMSGDKNIETDCCYNFKFFTKEEAQELNSATNNWFKVKEILTFKDSDELSDYIFDTYGRNKIASRNLNRLYNKLKTDKIINYFEIINESQDDALDVFVRINSAGTVLSKTDFLFSKIVLKWNEGREEIEDLLKTINKVNNGYSYSTDFVMKTLLYLRGLSASLKVNAFTEKTIHDIKEDWQEIKKSIIETIVFLNNNMGINAQNLTSDNVILPIIYFRYKNKKAFDIPKLPKINCNLQEIKKYIAISQTKHVFGQSTNQALDKIRNVLDETPEKFEFSNLQKIVFASGITMKFTEEDLISWFNEFEKGPYTFMLLSFLYPDIKFNQDYHQDHMHPYSAFEKKNEKKLKGKQITGSSHVVDDQIIKEWRYKRNTLANLQLLAGKENIQKNDDTLEQWLDIPENKKQAKYLPDTSYDILNFDNFIEKRKELMIEELKKQLGLLGI